MAPSIEYAWLTAPGDCTPGAISTNSMGLLSAAGSDSSSLLVSDWPVSPDCVSMSGAPATTVTTSVARPTFSDKGRLTTELALSFDLEIARSVRDGNRCDIRHTVDNGDSSANNYRAIRIRYDSGKVRASRGLSVSQYSRYQNPEEQCRYWPHEYSPVPFATVPLAPLRISFS
jgi:hypothetical protein